MPNRDHIFIPSGFDFSAQIEAERYPRKVWKRPWLTSEKPKGKVMDVVNQQVITMKGFKSWLPIQAALMALETATNSGVDTIRVKSPARYGRSGLKASYEKLYSVRELKEIARGSFLSPKIAPNTVKVGEGEHPLSGRWQLNEGILARAA